VRTQRLNWTYHIIWHYLKIQLDFGKGFTVSYLPAKKHASNWAWVKKLEHSIIPRKRLKTWNQKWKWARANEEALDFWEYVALHWSCDLCKAWLAKKNELGNVLCSIFVYWPLLYVFLYLKSNLYFSIASFLMFKLLNSSFFLVFFQQDFSEHR
jgi:hypothetical protein